MSQKKSKKLGVFAGAFFLVTYVVGAGIFTTVQDVFIEIRRFWPTLALWAVCGVLCMIGAMCYAELACMLPGEGGEHLYLGHGFGPWAVRLYDWMSFFVLRPSSIAFFSLKFVIIFIQTFSTVEPSEWTILASVSAFVAIITFLTVVLPGLSSKLEKTFTWTKICSLFMIIVLSLVIVCLRRNIFNNNCPEFIPNSPSLKDKHPNFADAIVYAVLTFDGWNGLNTIAGRFANPAKTIPYAIMFGTGFITLTYLLIALSYFFVFDFNQINYTVFQAIAVAFNRKEHWGRWIGNVFILAAVFSSTLAWISSAIDAFEVAVADGSLPKSLLRKNKAFKTPHIVLFLQAILTIGFCFFCYLLAKIPLSDENAFTSSRMLNSCSFFGVFPYCIFYLMTVLVLIREKLWAPSPITSHSFKAFAPLPYIYTLCTGALIGLLAYLNFKQAFLPPKERQTYMAFATVFVVGLMLLMLGISLLGAKSFAKKAKLNKMQELKAAENFKENTTLDLDKETPLPPQAVEKTFL